MKSLIRSALILVGIVAAPVLLSAQPVVVASSTTPHALAPASINALGPVIKFNTENYDFGKSIAGDPIRYTYQVTNAGDGMLDISNVKPSCGCTTVGTPSGGGSWTRQIAPHQTGVIPIEVHVTTKGQINKTVTVTSNDKSRPNVTLQIHGTVWTPIELSIPLPTVTFNLKADALSNNTQVIKIFNREVQPLTLSAPESSSKVFSAVLKTNDPGKEFELAITAGQPASLPSNGESPQMLQGAITMKTSSTKMKVLSIAALETVEAEIQVFPTQIQMPNSPLSRPLTNFITVRGNTGAPLTLSNPAINVPGVEVSVKTLTTNRQYSLVVAFPAGFIFPHGQSVIVTVESDNPRFPLISVPIQPQGLPPSQRRIIMPTAVQSAGLNRSLPAFPGRVIVMTNGITQPITSIPFHP